MQRKLVIGAVVLAAVGAGGGAYAATQGSSQSSQQAFLNDVAKRLSISPAQLRAALQNGFFDQLQAAVNEGRLTQAQANAIKQRVLQSGMLPFFGGPGFRGPRGPGFFGRPGGAVMAGGLQAAASYLGLSATQLRQQLMSGKSLAQVAQARGKTTNGLKQAITTAIRSRLDQAVAGGRITKAQEQQLLNALSSRLDAVINRTGPPAGQRGFHGRFGRFPGGGPPPPGSGPASGMPGAPPPQGPLY